MSNKHTDEMMGHLYQEEAPLDSRDKSSAFQKELESLEDTRFLLAQWKDQKAPPLPLMMMKPKKRSLFSHPFFQSSWTKAAAIALLMVASAAMMGMYVQWDQQSLTIGFGQANSKEEALREEWLQAQEDSQNAFRKMLEEQLTLQQISWQSEMNAMQKDLSAEVKAVNNRVVQQGKQKEISLGESQLAGIRRDLLQENYRMMTELIHLSERSQQNYTEQMLAQFSTYMERQRTEDLEMLSFALNDVLSFNDQKAKETENLLTQLISHIQQEPPRFNR